MKNPTALFFLAVTFLAACTSARQEAPISAKESSFTVYYNNDNFGYLEPCGCRVTPIGGFHRRWNAMMQTPESQRIFVDAGNLFFKSKSSPEYLSPQWLEQAKGVVEGYNLLKADAFTPGETDFALGLERLKELESLAKFKFLSSNLVDKQQQFIFQSKYIIERSGIKIGITGVYNPSFNLPSGIQALNPESSVRHAVKELKAAGVEFVIVLSHMGYEEDVKLAKALSEINLIVGASTQSLLQKPDREGKTDIVQLSNQGQMLGLMQYTKSENIRLTNAVVEELNSVYDDSVDQRIPNPMKPLIAVTNIRIGDANRKLDEKLWAAHQVDSGRGFQTFLNCRSCHSTQAEFQEGTRHAAAMLTLVARKKEQNLDCVKCHSVGMGEEGGFTKISNALIKKDGSAVTLEEVLKKAQLDNLAKSGKDYRTNPEHIRPDVARWIQGLKSAQVDKAFLSVQCENCHGPRPDHPFGLSTPGKVLTTRCISCHTKEQMPSWYDGKGKIQQEVLKADLKRVTCPK